MKVKPTNVEEYISSKPPKAQERLRELRGYLKLADPNAAEELKWGKPAFTNDGILYVYSASKTHLSLHPTPSVIEALHEELKTHSLSGNTIRFPLDAPIPEALVLKIAGLRVFEKNEKGIGWK